MYSNVKRHPSIICYHMRNDIMLCNTSQYVVQRLNFALFSLSGWLYTLYSIPFTSQLMMLI